MRSHWTTNSIQDYLSRITFDFIGQIEKRMEVIPLTQRELAKQLGVTEGAVSQTLNNTGSINLRRIVEYSKAVGMKIALVAYVDDDPENERGPINSDIFTQCWERQGRPVDFFDLNEGKQFSNYYITGATDARIDIGSNTDAGNKPIQETERKLRLVS